MVNRPIPMPARRSPRRAPGRPSPQVRPDSVNETYRALRAMGWTESQAGNLVAHLAGLDVTRKGWLIREVDGLLFMRSLVSSGRLDP